MARAKKRRLSRLASLLFIRRSGHRSVGGIFVLSRNVILGLGPNENIRLIASQRDSRSALIDEVSEGYRFLLTLSPPGLTSLFPLARHRCVSFFPVVYSSPVADGEPRGKGEANLCGLNQLREKRPSAGVARSACMDREIDADWRRMTRRDNTFGARLEDDGEYRRHHCYG